MADEAIVYVELEGQDGQAWRPVVGTRIGDGIYRLSAEAAPGERWEFPPGSAVVVQEREFPDGPHLVACGLVDAP